MTAPAHQMDIWAVDHDTSRQYRATCRPCKWSSELLASRPAAVDAAKAHSNDDLPVFVDITDEMPFTLQRDLDRAERDLSCAMDEIYALRAVCARTSTLTALSRSARQRLVDAAQGHVSLKGVDAHSALDAVGADHHLNLHSWRNERFS